MELIDVPVFESSSDDEIDVLQRMINRRKIRARIRGPNYSDVEKLAMIRIMQDFVKIIECKQTDGITIIEKKKAWEEVHKYYNTRFSTRTRTVESLQTLWTNLKRDTRKYKATQKQENRKTGGGPSEFKPNVVFEEMLKLINPLFESLENLYDSNADALTVETLFRDGEDANSLHDTKVLFTGLQNAGYITNWSKWDKKTIAKPVSSPLQDKLQLVLMQKARSRKNAVNGTKSEMKMESADLVKNETTTGQPSTSKDAEIIDLANIDEDLEEYYCHGFEDEEVKDEDHMIHITKKETLEGIPTSAQEKLKLETDFVPDTNKQEIEASPFQKDCSLEGKKTRMEAGIVADMKKADVTSVRCPLKKIAIDNINYGIPDEFENQEFFDDDEEFLKKEMLRQELKRVQLKNELLDVKIQKKRVKLEMLRAKQKRREELLENKEN